MEICGIREEKAGNTRNISRLLEPKTEREFQWLFEEEIFIMQI